MESYKLISFYGQFIMSIHSYHLYPRNNYSIMSLCREIEMGAQLILSMEDDTVKIINKKVCFDFQGSGK